MRSGRPHVSSSERHATYDTAEKVLLLRFFGKKIMLSFQYTFVHCIDSDTDVINFHVKYDVRTVYRFSCAETFAYYLIIIANFAK